MDYWASPELLGGIIIAVATCAWTLGRSQSVAQMQRSTPVPASLLGQAPLFVQSPLLPAPAYAEPCQREPRDSQFTTLDQTISLSDLHAEVSAYRHQEKIFATLAGDAFRIEHAQVVTRAGCRYSRLIRQPTLCSSDVTRAACDCEGALAGILAEAAMRPEPMVQPSPTGASFTRV